MKIGRIVGYTMLALIVIAAIGVPALVGIRPLIGPRMRPVTSRVYDRTPRRVERGQYLATTVSACLMCHSPHDWTKHDLPTPSGMSAAGGVFPLAGLPGVVTAANLTPDPETGLGRWSDDEIGRAIREGVDRDGNTLFPLMPYRRYRHLSDEDLASIVVYLRSLAPVHNPLPPTRIIFPVKYLIRNAPEPILAAVPEPDVSTPVNHGKYLVEIGGCEDCHTPQKRGQPLPNMNFAGGLVFEGPWGRVASANITPDATGFSYDSEAMFASAMRAGYTKGRALSPIMPWMAYRGLSDPDLLAIYAYLKTKPPARHVVDNTKEPTECRLCKARHGGGAENQ
jgi:mono/diheme cytochrome c family protein